MSNQNHKFLYAHDNKRYHTLYYHNQQVFGHRVYKAVLDGGFTCPNLDGTKGFHGCAFCDGGSGAFTKPLPLTEQLALELARIKKQNAHAKAIAYFQVHTNTYAPVNYLQNLFEQAILFPDIIGLSIGTRPDCLPDDVLDYLADLNQRTYLTVELGVQTVHDKTARNFNRGYDYAEFLKNYQKLKNLNIRTCLHMINGLPEENFSDMLQTARQLASLKPDAVKIQLLHILQNTKYAELYQSGKIQTMTQKDYIFTVVKQLELFPPETVIERITGDGEKAKLLAPDWSRNKIKTLGSIDKLQAELDTWQGKYDSSMVDFS